MMEKTNIEIVAFSVNKHTLIFIKDDEGYKKYIVNDLSRRLAERLVDILNTEGEIVAKISDVYCEEDDDFIRVDYRRMLEWCHLVRCKDCKHYWKNSNDFNDSTVCLASPKDEAFCSEGERKETEDVH